MTPIDTIARETRLRAAAVATVYAALSKYSDDPEQVLDMTKSVARAIQRYKKERARELNQLAGGRLENSDED